MWSGQMATFNKQRKREINVVYLQIHCYIISSRRVIGTEWPERRIVSVCSLNKSHFAEIPPCVCHHKGPLHFPAEVLSSLWAFPLHRGRELKRNGACGGDGAKMWWSRGRETIMNGAARGQGVCCRHFSGASISLLSEGLRPLGARFSILGCGVLALNHLLSWCWSLILKTRYQSLTKLYYTLSLL